jgi:hypothetical protein
LAATRVVESIGQLYLMPRRRRAILSAVGPGRRAYRTYVIPPAICFFDWKATILARLPFSSAAISIHSPGPAEVSFTADLRHCDPKVMARLGSIIKLVCETEKGPCQFQIEDVSNFQPIDFNPALVARLAAAAEASRLPSMPLVSLAGHDAYMMHHVCPTAMLFVPVVGFEPY